MSERHNPGWHVPYDTRTAGSHGSGRKIELTNYFMLELETLKLAKETGLPWTFVYDWRSIGPVELATREALS